MRNHGLEHFAYERPRAGAASASRPARWKQPCHDPGSNEAVYVKNVNQQTNEKFDRQAAHRAHRGGRR